MINHLHLLLVECQCDDPAVIPLLVGLEFRDASQHQLGGKIRYF